MTSKFTLRDFLVYSFIGMTAGILICIHHTTKARYFIESLYDFSKFSIIILIPISYLTGHLVMGIDDILFNRLLRIPIRKVNHQGAHWYWKAYNFIFFGYRNNGIKWVEEIHTSTFLEMCDFLVEKKLFDKPEYHQILSDLFKGIVLCLVTSIILGLFRCELYFWEIGILSIAWYRARMFSAYFVRMVKRNAKNLKTKNLGSSF